MNKKHKVILSVGLVIGIWLLVIQLGLAWTNPTATPPAGNPPAPLNVGPDTQTKTGGLNIATVSGNVGIGTAAPGARLHIDGSGELLRLTSPGHGTIVAGSDVNLPWFGTLTNHSLRLVTNNIERVRIDTGGNVGIGTTVPAAGLDINRGATNDLALALRSSGAGWGSGMQLINTAATGRNYGIYSGSAGNLHIADNIAGVDRIVITPAGNVGIGTTAPAVRLHVMGGRTMIENTAHSLGADAHHLELFAPMGAAAGETSLRFHQGGRWWHQIRARSDGFRFTTGNTDALTHIAAGNVTATAYFHHSDRALKSNIQPIANGLQRVLGLEPVMFNWKDSGETSLGFVAQNVEQQFPELVATDKQGSKSVNYSGLIAPLVQAIQEQQRQIEELRAEVGKLR